MIEEEFVNTTRILMITYQCNGWFLGVNISPNG